MRSPKRRKVSILDFYGRRPGFMKMFDELREFMVKIIEISKQICLNLIGFGHSDSCREILAY